MPTFPYADRFEVHRTLPETGLSRDEVLSQLHTMATEEDQFWEGGKVSGTMYCGDHEHYAFMNEAFGLFAHVNVLQRDICPSATKFEAEIISMVLALHHGEAAAATGDEPCGLVTSGGTGSITHAVLAYREHAAQTRGVTRPNMIKPETAHPAFDKACHLFGVELRRAPVDPVTTQVDVDWGGTLHREANRSTLPARILDRQSRLGFRSGSGHGALQRGDIAAHKLRLAVHHHLRRVGGVQRKVGLVALLALGHVLGRKRILPALAIPVRDVLAQHDEQYDGSVPGQHQSPPKLRVPNQTWTWVVCTISPSFGQPI